MWGRGQGLQGEEKMQMTANFLKDEQSQGMMERHWQCAGKKTQNC